MQNVHKKRKENSVADHPYPEHLKMEAIQDKSQAIGQFLDWLLHERPDGVVDLVVFDEDIEQDVNVRWSMSTANKVNIIQGLLAEYFDIDLVKIEKEKQAMIEACRAQETRKDNA